MPELIADNQTADELLSDKHHGRANARLIAARINDGSLVDKEKLSQLLTAAMALAAAAATRKEERPFCALMKVIQAQQKIEISEVSANIPKIHLHGHSHSDDQRRAVADILTRVGATRTADRYLARG